MTEWTPSAFQRAIFDDVECGAGHTLILARAGCGKTTTIVGALEYVPRRERALLLAFNKEIAEELKQRAPPHADVRTLHSLGFGAMRRAFGDVELNDRRVDEILSERLPFADDRIEVSRAVGLAKASLAEDEGDVERLIDEYGVDAPNLGRDSIVAEVLWCLHACKKQPRIINYDDMVWLPVVLGLPVKQAGRVFVDETQDLTRSQVELALRACRPGGRICAVGDDRQAIYGFRGADHRAVKRIVERLRARVLPLSVTYRCPRAVVALAQEIVPDLRAAPSCEEGLVREIDEDDIPNIAQPGDFLLSRTNAPLLEWCFRFLARGVPAIISGRDIGVRLAARIRAFRARSLVELVDRAHAWAATEVAKARRRNPSADPTAPRDTAACIEVLAKNSSCMDDVLSKIGQLFPKDATDADRITLSTTHKAKGLERDRVIMLSDTYPRARSRDDGEPDRRQTEGQNLRYVAITRARRELYLAGAA